jgi:hypothetical protein
VQRIRGLPPKHKGRGRDVAYHSDADKILGPVGEIDKDGLLGPFRNAPGYQVIGGVCTHSTYRAIIIACDRYGGRDRR